MTYLEPIVKVEKLTAGYNRRPVLDAVNFSVGRGEVVVIIGQNGSGKSTLLKTIAGILRAMGGIVVFADNIANPKAHELAKSGISYFTQNSLAIPALTIKEHFHLTLMNLGKKTEQAALQAIVTDFPALAAKMNHRAGNLSGGERQLLSFAMLSLQASRFWLLDEPTAGLSPSAVAHTSAYLKKMNEKGITMLLVEHNMQVAFEVASHIMIAKGGTLTRKFNREEFLAPGFLSAHLYS